ncbi:MAG: DeoR/GlpR family DNA-binding transcription regulator [Spirochaetales bacterium]|uniref:DeoR/GlpR family DNA-binding transcription regulator n=1 Tax=Candidatus Thalassospirochaeta sargassi TaxID=3119039 RepID=A0AAJ1IC74_9SPIO|nr:DeoR/GlpR family DNA-binding transcription regulator [Spirochaetales bacterium]
MPGSLIPAGRRNGMLAEIKEKGFAGVDELAEKFDVSVITVRRDLDQLELEGHIERTHGGAIYTRHISSESTYKEKNVRNHGVKAAIGRRAAELASSGDTIFVNSGSTTFQIIVSLLEIPDIRIITNNISAALEVDIPSGSEMILIGGQYRANSGCTIGSFAAEMIGRLNVSRTFIGADGISLKSGITSPVAEEAAVTRLMIERTAGPVVIAADSSKVGSVSTFFTAALDQTDFLVTDGNFDETFRPDFEEAGIEIIKAEDNSTGD